MAETGVSTPRIDLGADFNMEDDEGRKWTLLRDAREGVTVAPALSSSRARRASGQSYASSRCTTTAWSPSSDSPTTIPRPAPFLRRPPMAERT
jgi:hypothetical protein